MSVAVFLVGLGGAGCPASSDPDPAPTPDSGVMMTPDSGVVVPGCGDGVLATDEQCEGFELRGETCISQGFTSGRLRCASDCTLDTSACVRCGNDTLEEGEVCDGTDVGGATCASLLGEAYTGTVACAEGCLAHVTDACELVLPEGELSACDSTAQTSCAGDLTCLTTAQGDYCLQECDVDVPTACDPEDVCIDLGPPRQPAFACVPRPGLGDACSEMTGCGEGSCAPTFEQGGNPVSVCATSCTLPYGEGGRGDCAAGFSCSANPGGFYEEEAGAISCTVAAVTRECSVGDGYECLTVGIDASGAPIMRCARYLRQCVAPQDFFAFASATVPESARCDLAGPTSGGRYCGLLGTIAEDPARVRCFPIFEGVDSVGACVGFCDPILNDDGITDLDCGTGASCLLPAAPQFFFPQEPSVSCVGADESVCDATSGFDRCVDFGAGPECARPSKVCVPVGG